MNKRIEDFGKSEDIPIYLPTDIKPAGKENSPYTGTLGRTEWEIIAKIIIGYNQENYEQEQDKNKPWKWKRVETLPNEYKYYIISMIDAEYLEGDKENGYMLTVYALEKIKAKHPAKKPVE